MYKNFIENKSDILYQAAVKAKSIISLRWNAIGGIGYQLLLVAHQIALYCLLDTQTYAHMSIVFSISYLAISLIDGGFRESLAPFFSTSSASKRNFLRYVCKPWTFQLIIIAMVGVLISGYAYVHNGIPIASIVLDPFTIAIACIFVGTEWIEQGMKQVLQLNFKARTVALWEISYIALYLSMVWGYYLLTAHISLYSLLIPLIFCSALGIGILALPISRSFAQLPSHNTPAHTETLPHNDHEHPRQPNTFSGATRDDQPLTQQEPADFGKRIARTRLVLYINQTGHLFFSANFLVPFFATHCGLNQAGMVKIASHIAYTIVALFNHIFGITSTAVFASLKKISPLKKNDLFSFLTHRMNLFFYALLFCFTLALPLLMKIGGTTSNASILAILFCVLLNLSDIALITYEKLFITEEKAHYLVLCNMLNMCCAIGILIYGQHLHPYLTLAALMLMRSVYMSTIMYLARKMWHLQTPSPIRTLYHVALRHRAVHRKAPLNRAERS